NLWLEPPRDRVLILDFGLARSATGTDGLSRYGAILGTPGYLSPEQADGLDVDAPSDLFALGATLYHAATGTAPFRRPTQMATLRAVAEHRPPEPREVNPAVPARLSDVIMRLLAKRPEDRPVSAAAVAGELVVAAGRPSSERMTGVAGLPP